MKSYEAYRMTSSNDLESPWRSFLPFGTM